MYFSRLVWLTLDIISEMVGLVYGRGAVTFIGIMKETMSVKARTAIKGLFNNPYLPLF